MSTDPQLIFFKFQESESDRGANDGGREAKVQHGVIFGIASLAAG